MTDTPLKPVALIFGATGGIGSALARRLSSSGWRLALAANLLKRSSLSTMQIALEVGYERDTAFSRAFRREFGLPPASWRRRNNTESGEAKDVLLTQPLSNSAHHSQNNESEKADRLE